MMQNPKVQTKAQTELDAVLGNERLPSLSDRTHLPYIDCVLKEVLRFSPVAPLGPFSVID
jgi:cytochrome P450